MNVVRIAGSDASFECAVGESLLDGAARHGIELPYSCRKGVCGNCAGRVPEGEVVGVRGAPMTNETCLPGQVLFCMCAPVSTAVIAPTEWHRIDPGARKKFTARVFRNQRVAPDVSLLQLRLPTGQRAKFKAGQYLRVTAADGSTRCYSMANPPHESDSLSLHIRHVPGGSFSTRVPELHSGDTLEVELPFGAFSLREGERPIVLVAGGTGFAPIKSILDDMARRNVDRPTTLIWAARQADGIYLRPAVEKWQKKWPGFRFVAALSDATDALPEGFVGARADQALVQCMPALQGHELYCCGGPPMVAAVREAALRLGLDPRDFHSDVFVEGPAVPG